MILRLIMRELMDRIMTTLDKKVKTDRKEEKKDREERMDREERKVAKKGANQEGKDRRHRTRVKTQQTIRIFNSCRT